MLEGASCISRLRYEDRYPTDNRSESLLTHVLRGEAVNLVKLRFFSICPYYHAVSGDK